jgi:hypothetical protein
MYRYLEVQIVFCPMASFSWEKKKKDAGEGI